MLQKIDAIVAFRAIQISTIQIDIFLEHTATIHQSAPRSAIRAPH